MKMNNNEQNQPTLDRQRRVKTIKTIFYIIVACIGVACTFFFISDEKVDNVAPKPMDSRLVIDVQADELLKNLTFDNHENAWFKIVKRSGYLVVRSTNREQFLSEMGMVPRGDSMAVKVIVPGMKWDDGETPSLSLPRNDGVVSVPVWLLIKWIDQGYIETSANQSIITR